MGSRRYDGIRSSSANSFGVIMKLIGSWDAKYFGFVYKGMAYYVGWNHPTCRDWGYTEDWYDGPIHRFSLYFIAFLKHYDRG